MTEWGENAVGPATLCFIQQDEDVLLIEKKRGAGAGLLNAPGGKVKSGESPVTATKREVKEEVGIVVGDLEKRGEILFRVGDELFSFVHVFHTNEFNGTPSESSEGQPKWVRWDNLPFARMWSGDKLWVPRVLTGKKIRGRITLSTDTESVCAHSLRDVCGFAGGPAWSDRNSYRE